jgi:hypothetical protein
MPKLCDHRDKVPVLVKGLSEYKGLLLKPVKSNQLKLRGWISSSRFLRVSIHADSHVADKPHDPIPSSLSLNHTYIDAPWDLQNSNNLGATLTNITFRTSA